MYDERTTNIYEWNALYSLRSLDSPEAQIPSTFWVGAMEINPGEGRTIHIMAVKIRSDGVCDESDPRVRWGRKVPP